MSKFIIYCDDDEISSGKVSALEAVMGDFVEADTPIAVEFVFVDGEEIRRLNREMRDTDKVTDVLSFPALDGIKGEKICGEDFPYEIDEEGNLMLGSIVVCCDRAHEQADEYGHSYERELHYLLVHGMMHCLGYDHETDDDRTIMREKEDFILNKLGITRED